MTDPTNLSAVDTAVEAYRRGYQPIPIRDGDKRPYLGAWTRQRWTETTDAKVREQFEQWAEEGAGNVGVLLGDASQGLIDVDLDHPATTRLKNHFLPRTLMRSGRPGRPMSHYWYLAEPGTLQGTKRHKMPEPEGGGVGAVSVEYRSNLAQTVLPGSVHPSGEVYRWEGTPWGGAAGPTRVNGQVLATQVALLGLGTVLIENWPKQGSRHDAYLALAGGLLRFGDHGIHPYWERNAAALIEALADATHDEDGPEARVKEVMGTTLGRLRRGEQAVGFTRLGEIIGDRHARQARFLVAEVESAAGFQSRDAMEPPREQIDLAPEATSAKEAERAADVAETPLEERDPLSERLGSWEPVDLDPYLSGQVRQVDPAILRRADGQALLYPGRVNMLYGSSESAKSWLALETSLQEMARGANVMYLDFEDEPVNTLQRLRLLGAGDDEIRLQFTYIRPETPLAPMQRDRWGHVNATQEGAANDAMFMAAVNKRDPSLIVADGMTVLYGLHGLDANDAVSTDVITGWLKKLTRNGRSTVIVIDHTTKGAEKGALPIGSQHKVAMVQGTMLQVWAIKQPMPGAVGLLELVVLKDRPGQVRAVSQKSGTKAQVAAVVTMDSTKPGQTLMTIDAPPDAVTQASAGVMDMKRAEEAQQAEEQRDLEWSIVNLFGGELGKRHSMRYLMDTLDPKWPRSQSAKGDWSGRAVQAVKRLAGLLDPVSGSIGTYLEAVGGRSDRMYELLVGSADEVVVDLSTEHDD